MELILDIEKNLPNVDAADYRSKNNQLFIESKKTCIVIDDDPTGNQTVHGVPLLAEWDIHTLEEEFKKKTQIFFLLTNSRSLTAKKTEEIYTDILNNIKKASNNTNREYLIISRSDSTLRGHFNTEVNTIQKVENNSESITLFIPVMFEGGRVTIDDVHYIMNKESLLPVGESSFAKDHTFGYQNSNLKDWIQEKTNGEVEPSKITSISIKNIREESIEVLTNQILKVTPGSYCIANAINYNDLDKVCNALLLAEKRGKNILYRTSSSFVPSYIGLRKKELLNASDIYDSKIEKGGLVIVGSYVTKSSFQLNYLLENKNSNTTSIEVAVDNILSTTKQEYLNQIISKIDQEINLGNDVIVFTSRKIITGNTEEETIEIANKISESLISLVRHIKNQPKYILAKGGITSHDIATKGLGMKRAITIGQILPGVPVWKMGEETRFPNLGYIVFPGNVGEEKSLFQLTQILAQNESPNKKI